jgi:regulator of protease activity HflC (stomatin/prohibitin superfamily)
MGELIGLLRSATEIFRWWVTIAPWESAVRVRLGNRVAVLGPGVHLRIPYVDDVFQQSVRMRIATVPTQTVTTWDNRTLTLGATIGFQIVDVLRLYQTLHHPEGTIVNMVLEAIAGEVARTPASELQPASLAHRAASELDLERFGLGAVTVRITDFAFVRTYRLIQDQRWGNYGDGDALNIHGGSTTKRQQ